MAPTPSAKPNQMGQTPTSTKSNHSHVTHSRTPQSKHRLNFNAAAKPSPNPHSAVRESPQLSDHPVEVVGRIRDYPDRKEKPISILQVNAGRKSVRVKTEIGYRDFTLDGVSLSEDQDLDGFYKTFVESRINGVKMGDKCTIMMYGPTGSGKSHTMFGCAKEQGIVYRSLKGILGNSHDEGDGDGDGGGERRMGVGAFVQVTVLEIYNEEIYDLLSTNGGGGGGGFSLGWSKNASKVKLEVMGKKAKNASFISGTEADKISREIQKVEKRRIVKSTLCNERSSRSHCMIILDVPTVGGRLMLVDMAGSENIEQAGQNGFEAKMQTAKINQGNIALKRVVESIANGDSHVPFRDSKLTMLLQDSFEDDKSKILMVLCASPDPKEMHKTVSTLEYGAKAKCIVRGPHTPVKDKAADDPPAVLGSRIAVMDQFIYKLQMENKIREKEKMEALSRLSRKEEEVADLRARLAAAETGPREEEIDMKVNERTVALRAELERKVLECREMADRVVEMERRKMEAKILQQQEELETLRRRLQEIESELTRSRNGSGNGNVTSSTEGSGFARRLMGMYAAADDDPGMEKSMDLDRSLDMDQKTAAGGGAAAAIQAVLGYPLAGNLNDEEYGDVYVPNSIPKTCLSTVYEEEENEAEDDKERPIDEEVRKEVIEEKTVYSVTGLPPPESVPDTAASRQLRIQNIFTLCGNYRELSQRTATPCPTSKRPADEVLKLAEPLGPFDRPENRRSLAHKMNGPVPGSDENQDPLGSTDGLEVLVKWEEGGGGRVITTLRVVKDATLADLRKLVEIYLAADNQAFAFLALGDPTGAPVAKEDESSVLASKLPTCNNSQTRLHLACLRPAKRAAADHVPFASLENDGGPEGRRFGLRSAR